MNGTVQIFLDITICKMPQLAITQSSWVQCESIRDCLNGLQICVVPKLPVFHK